MNKIVLGIGGSSGSIYAKRILDLLAEYDDLHVGVVMSKNAFVNWELEVGKLDLSLYPFVEAFENTNFFAPFASGSSSYNAMIICPCSMGLLSRIAGGFSSDLLTRAADVMLKERRKLVIVPRETPYNLIHLENMTRLTQAGAIICPATPSFYHNPQTLEQIADTVVERVLDLAGYPAKKTKRWQE